MTALVLSSCSENDDSYDEYANWQERNEQAFADTLAYAKKMGESQGWYVYRKWSLENQTPNKDVNGVDVPLSYKDCDHIIVHVLDKGEGTTSPLYTDSVKVSYRGRLIETTDKDGNVNAGYVFDKNFEGTYNKKTAMLSTFAVSNVVDGFATALMHMHPGSWSYTAFSCRSSSSIRASSAPSVRNRRTYFSKSAFSSAGVFPYTCSMTAAGFGREYISIYRSLP